MKHTNSTHAAYVIANLAHATQRRDFDQTPYITHLLRVAEMASAQGLSENQIAAAFLHDVLEDFEYTQMTEERPRDNLRMSNFDGNISIVVSLVKQLTHEYTKEKHPDMNRRERKALEAKRLWNISTEAKDIKLADMIDNLSDIKNHDREFARKYLAEKREILRGFVGTNPVLFEMANKLANQEL